MKPAPREETYPSDELGCPVEIRCPKGHREDLQLRILADVPPALMPNLDGKYLVVPAEDYPDTATLLD